MKTNEVRLKITEDDDKVFRQMAEDERLEPAAFLQSLIREEAKRRDMWPPPEDDGEPRPNWMAPDPPKVVTRPRDKPLQPK